MPYVVEFHLSPDAIAMDPDNGEPSVVGPFDSWEAAQAFGAKNLSFFHRAVVSELGAGLISPETWLSEWVEAV